VTRVPSQYKAIPDPDQDRLSETIEDLRRLELFARERGDTSRADQLGQMAAAYEAEQRRREDG
jgi:hypothetical protein